MKKLIFVSHPCRGDIINNRKKVNKICKYLMSKELIAISPVNAFDFIGLHEYADEEGIMTACKRMIVICDEVWVYGESQGCNQELAFAKEIGKKYRVLYEHVDYKKMMEDVGYKL